MSALQTSLKKVHIQFYPAFLLHTKITLTLRTKTKEKTKPEMWFLMETRLSVKKKDKHAKDAKNRIKEKYLMS